MRCQEQKFQVEYHNVIAMRCQEQKFQVKYHKVIMRCQEQKLQVEYKHTVPVMWVRKVRKNGGSELRSVLARPAHPRLLRAPTMDSLTQPTSLVRGANAEIGRKRTHRGRRSSEARIRQSLLRSSKRPFHREKRRHVDHPGSGAGDLVASREKDQSGGFGRLQAKRRKIAVTGAIAQRRFSTLPSHFATYCSGNPGGSSAEVAKLELRNLAQDRDQWFQLCSQL